MLSVARAIRSSPIRSSRSDHDSGNPCRAWARSPTMVKLRDGQRQQQHLPLGVGQLLRLVHDDVRERAGEQVRVAAGQRGLVDQGVPQVLPAQHRHHEQLGVVGGDQVVDHLVMLLALGGDGGLVPTPAPGRLRVAEPLPGRVQQRQVGHRPGPGVRALQRPYVVGAEPGRAPAQVRRHRPQVADEVGRLEQRPRPVEGRAQRPVLLQRPPEQVGARRRRRACRSGS